MRVCVEAGSVVGRDVGVGICVYKFIFFFPVIFYGLNFFYDDEWSGTVPEFLLLP